MKHLAFIINFCFILLVASCAPEPFISVDKEAFEIGYEGGEVKVVVTSNYVWTASSVNSDVVTIDPAIGSAGDTATITVLENQDGIPKELQVMFSCTSSKTYSKVNVIIVQGFAQPVITAEALYSEIDYPKTEVPIIINSNFIWTSSYDRTLLSLSSTTGKAGKDTVIATISENRGEIPISHNIDFICSSVALSDTSSVTITQNIAPSPSISINPQSKEISASGGSFTANISSRYEWTAAASEGIELSAGIGDGDSEITITVPENTSSETRYHFVKFSSSIRQEVASATLYIIQAVR